jgi:hypothetical protein
VGTKDSPGLPIDSVFTATLRDFSIPDTSLHIVKKNKTIVPHKYTVTLTGDLLVPLIINDLQTHLSPYGIEVIGHEAKINGEGNIEMYSKDHQLLFNAYITINKNAVRDCRKVSIIIQGLDEASLSNKKKFCADIEEKAFIILPSKENIQVASLLRAHGNECIIELSDNIPDQEYKLLDEFNNKRLLQSVKAMDSDIRGVYAYYINTQSKLYRSPKFRIVKSGLKDKKLMTDNGLHIIPYQKDDGVFQNALSDILFRPAQQQNILLAVDYRNYNLIAPYIAKFIKKGGKVVKLTAITN